MHPPLRGGGANDAPLAAVHPRRRGRFQAALFAFPAVSVITTDQLLSHLVNATLHLGETK